MKPPTLILSYSLKDARWASRFSEALRAANVLVRNATEMPSDRHWESWLRRALADSEAVVPILSTDSATSPWLLLEMGAASESGKPIFPVVLSDRPPSLPLIQTRASLRATTPKETARRLIASLTGEESPNSKSLASTSHPA